MALVVVTGGARSGKSSAALELALVRELDGARIVVAAFGREADDAEFAERVDSHRRTRPESWVTIEAMTSDTWCARVPDDATLLVDCLGTFTGLAMEEAYDACAQGGLGAADGSELPPGFAVEFEARVAQVLDWLVARTGDTIVVTNEVGEGVVPAYASGRFFRDELGRMNRRLVAAADAAYLCVAGRALELTALPAILRWPED